MNVDRQISNKTPRLAIIGAGVLGATLALEATNAGVQVTIFERDRAPQGASVRNFGLLWISGRAHGEELRLAIEARQKWEEIADIIPAIGFNPRGSLTMLTRQDELDLAIAAIATDPKNLRQLSILHRSEILDMGLDIGYNVIGGMYCAVDSSIEPRLTVPSLLEHLCHLPNFDIQFASEVSRVNDGVVALATGEHYAFDAIVSTTGSNYGGFLSRLFEPKAVGLGLTRLIMTETAPITRRIGPAIADGDSMRYYPFFQFENAPQLQPQADKPETFGAQLLMVQRPNGAITIGDTHEHDPNGTFEIDTSITSYFIEKAKSIFPSLDLQLASVWEGTYSQPLDRKRAYVAKRLQDNFLLVTGTGGRGMTLAPSIAHETFEWLTNYFARTL